MSFVTEARIDVNALLADVADSGLGGTVMFLGSVRQSAEDGPVAEIEYSAYEEMVEAEFGRIVDEAHTRWPDARIAAVHRIGRVPAGEPSIAVVAGAPHRVEAFEACRHVIEEAKKRLPVWKKEIFENGAEAWREN
jgi:molybdopterin synthase catalytic subunit